MATHATPTPENTALICINSTLQVANPQAPPPSVQQWAEQGLITLKHLFDVRTSLLNKEQGLQSQLADTQLAVDQTYFDIGDCLIEINASLPKNPGRFGSTGWEYFTAQTKKTFGLDAGTASQYMSIARHNELRKLQAEGALNGEGRTTLYELSRIGSPNKFAEIKSQNYLTPGGKRVPHSKAEAWRKECDESKSAEQKTSANNEADAEEFAERCTTNVTHATTQQQVVHFSPPPCTEKQKRVMQKRLELNFKIFQEEFPECAGYYFIVKVTQKKPTAIN